MEGPAEHDDYLTTKDVAVALRLARSTVYTRFHSGSIKAHKVSRRWHVYPRDLQDYLDSLPGAQATGV